MKLVYKILLLSVSFLIAGAVIVDLDFGYSTTGFSLCFLGFMGIVFGPLIASEEYTG